MQYWAKSVMKTDDRKIRPDENSFFLGIDTSNYKTSVSLLDHQGALFFQKSELLEVKKGECGLRQSTAYFNHGRRLPSFLKEGLDCMREKCPEGKIRAVALSFRPRNVEKSYMPVFLAGLEAGVNIGNALNIPVYGFSHQEGHIHSVISGTLNEHPAVEEPEKPFIFFHISGGTTEALLCSLDGIHYSAEIAGGTKDISLGQLLDRAGVQAGFPFPAGKYLDQLALAAPVTVKPSKVRIRDGWFNLSGQETQVRKKITPDDCSCVPGIFHMISELLAEEAFFLCNKYGIIDLVIAGGVGASKYLRTNVPKELEGLPGMRKATTETIGPRIHWGSPELSGDNGSGIAGLGYNAWISGEPSHANMLLDFLNR